MAARTVRWVAVLAAGLVLGLPGGARAADATSVLSSGDRGDPFDGSLELRYDWGWRHSRISREFVCTPGLPGCPATPGTVNRAELDAKRTTHVLNVDARIGLWHDLELLVTLPVSLGDRTRMGYAPGVDGSSSTVDPAGGPSLLDATYDGPDRKGLGDLSVGLRYAPLCQWRKSWQPDLLLGITYTAPTGDLKRAGNDKVGQGLHGLRIEMAASRLFRFVEPYMGIQGQVWFPAGTTLYRNYDAAAQDRVAPGPTLGLDLGTEWYAWRVARADGKPERFASFDVGLTASYHFAGREQTDLFDALGASACGGDPLCVSSRASKNLLAYDRTLDGKSQGISTMDGVTDVSPYGTVGVGVGVTVQPVKWVALSVRFQYARETSHFLTWANTGNNGDVGNNTIELVNSQGKNEFNPVYNSDVDDPGSRLRSDGADLYGVMVRLTGRL